MNKFRLGVSTCLIEEKEEYIVNTLGKWFELIPFNREYQKLKSQGISGFIVKSGYNVPEIQSIFPLTPVENISGLIKPEVRDRFITSIFILNRWRELQPLSDSIREFHETSRYLLISFNGRKYSELSYILFRKGNKSFWDLKVRYQRTLMELLKTHRNRAGINRALIKMFSIFKDELNREDRYELQHTIKLFYRGLVPLLEPITLIKHYVKSLQVDKLMDQSFIYPDPIELNLLYHA